MTVQSRTLHSLADPLKGLCCSQKGHLEELDSGVTKCNVQAVFHGQVSIGNTAFNNVQPISWFAQLLRAMKVLMGTMIFREDSRRGIKYAAFLKLNSARTPFLTKEERPMAHSSGNAHPEQTTTVVHVRE